MKLCIPNRMFKCGINILSCSLIVGCAATPPTQEMSDARQSVEAAKSVGAGKHAPVALDSAQHLLSKAQNDLEAGDFAEAQKEAIAAREAARQAVSISQTKQTEQVEQNNTEPAKPELETIPEPEPEPEPEQTLAPSPVTYVVSKNDSLWKIAAKDSVYGDPFLWPLILKNNSNLIKTADQIAPGLILNIEIKPSPVDIKAAKQHAKHRSSTSAKHQDLSYLNQYKLR